MFPRQVKDRVVQNPRRYKLNPVSGQTDTYDLEPVTGTVTEAGTPINRGYLQPLEDSAAAATGRLRKEKSGKDDEGVFTVVEYKRSDNTLFARSTLSGGVAPLYATRTIQYYDNTGSVVIDTVQIPLQYDEDEDLIRG